MGPVMIAREILKAVENAAPDENTLLINPDQAVALAQEFLELWEIQTVTDALHLLEVQELEMANSKLRAHYSEIQAERNAAVDKMIEYRNTLRMQQTSPSHCGHQRKSAVGEYWSVRHYAGRWQVYVPWFSSPTGKDLVCEDFVRNRAIADRIVFNHNRWTCLQCGLVVRP